jgi:quercetin dioxygenase-like cupin family protein
MGGKGVYLEKLEHVNWEDVEEIEARSGIFRKIVTIGDIQVVRYRYLPGSEFETHSHPEEQLTIGIAGELIFNIDEDVFKFVKGDISHVPGNVPHSAENGGKVEAVTLNIYHPPRGSAP